MNFYPSPSVLIKYSESINTFLSKFLKIQDITVATDGSFLITVFEVDVAGLSILTCKTFADANTVHCGKKRWCDPICQMSCPLFDEDDIISGKDIIILSMPNKMARKEFASTVFCILNRSLDFAWLKKLKININKPPVICGEANQNYCL